MTERLTPLEEVRRRIQALQKALDAHDMDGALVVQRADLFYFSGTAQDAHLFVPRTGNAILLVRRDFERARAESPLTEIHEARSLHDLKEAMQSFVSGNGATLGLELDVLPVNNFRMYEGLFPGVAFQDASPLIKDVRMIKSAFELDLIEQAAAMNHALFGHVKDVLREGLTEMEFAGILEAFYRKLGHQGYLRVRSFNQEVFYGHVMSGSSLAMPSCSVGPTGGPGPNTSMPQGAGPKRIGRNEPVQIDFVGIVDGYMVDQARTFFIGTPGDAYLRTHDVALEIQEAVVREGKPGIGAEDLYETALRIAERADPAASFMGYPQPVPFVGHGVGLELDEWPLVGRKSPHILAPGMVIALEPKFIFPGKGLAGIENTFVVTEDGMRKLTPFDDTIQVLDHGEGH